MTEVLLWLILIGTALTAVLVIALLVRASRGVQGAGKELRDGSMLVSLEVGVFNQRDENTTPGSAPRSRS